MKMKKTLQILLILLVFALSFVITYFIITGKFSDYISSYKIAEYNITYKLTEVSTPLESSKEDECISSGYGYNIYNDGRISYSRIYNDSGWPEDRKDLQVFIKDENGNDLKVYKLFFDESNNMKTYAISLDNKLYTTEFSHYLTYNKEIIAQLVNTSTVKSITYNKKNKKVSLRFSNNESLNIDKYNEGYNLLRK